MAIYFVTGVPGCGKTFYMVNHLMKTYYDYLKTSGIFVLKKQFQEDKEKGLQELKIITNIEELKIPHLSLDTILKECKFSRDDAQRFFCYEYQLKVHQKYPRIVYMIDEAQQYFRPTSKMLDDCKYYFEKHRHFGDDVYIASQDRSKVNKEIALIAEKEIRGVPRSLTIPGVKQYNHLAGKWGSEVLHKELVRAKKEVYAVYTSMSMKETVKLKNPYVKYIVILLIVGGFCFYKVKNNRFFSKSTRLKELQASQKTGSLGTKDSTGKVTEKTGSQKQLTMDLPVQGTVLVNGKLKFYENPLTKKFEEWGQNNYPMIVKRGRLYMTVPVSEVSPEKKESPPAKSS